jgi:hypothetical protein
MTGNDTKLDELTDFMRRLADDPNAKPTEGIQVHITPTREPCSHEWNNGGINPEYCVKCGMSLIAHAFMECP